MADLTSLRRSPVQHLHDRMRDGSVTGERAVALREVPFLTAVSVRVEPGSPAWIRLGERLGADLPQTCGQVSSAGPRTALWFGPDEWLVVAGDEDQRLAGAGLAAELHHALGGDPGSVVDVSANRTTLELSGPAARATLEKGCPIDLHPRSFGPGTAVLTNVGPVPVVLWQTGANTYRLLPRSSFADYVTRWLLDAATEFAGPAVA
jgi:sarcosine oxidase subunit gamma